MAQITPEQAAQAVQRLEQIADELGAISTWLSLGDLDQPAIVLEDATRDVLAAAHQLQRRTRRYPAGWLNGEPYTQYGPQRAS